MSYECKIILDSLAPSGGRLTTFEITFPRMVLAEFNTHRLFSRNSASSRAIPVEKMLKRLEEDPFYPIYWGKNQKGMQSEEELSETNIVQARAVWGSIINDVVIGVNELLDAGIHKQITNRWLEPAMWHTAIVSATEYKNWFNLRDNKQAQPEIKEIAHMMKEMYFKSNPIERQNGDWHLPYVEGYDKEKLVEENYSIADMIDISVARCARVSCLTQDGIRDPKIDIAMARERLIPSGHMSPSEHVAQSLTIDKWVETADKMANDWIYNCVPVGNFWGWLQYRKTLNSEHCFPEPK